MGMIPIGDDDSDRTLTPLVNYLLIAANVAVFVLLQGMGGNNRFTYAFSTVPQEIVSGKDVVTRAHTVRDPASGQTFEQPGLQPTPLLSAASSPRSPTSSRQPRPTATCSCRASGRRGPSQACSAAIRCSFRAGACA